MFEWVTLVLQVHEAVSTHRNKIHDAVTLWNQFTGVPFDVDKMRVCIQKASEDNPVMQQPERKSKTRPVLSASSKGEDVCQRRQLTHMYGRHYLYLTNCNHLGDLEVIAITTAGLTEDPLGAR